MKKYSFKKFANLDRLTLEVNAHPFTFSLDHMNSTEDELDIFFRGELTGSELNALAEIVREHVNEPLEENIPEMKIVGSKKDSKGLTMVSIYEPEGSSATIGTHDFTDKCTWFGFSIAVNMEVLLTDNNIDFRSEHTFWIDLTHGRCYDEDVVVKSNPAFVPSVYIEGQLVNKNKYTIDYEKGTIKFKEAVSSQVKVSYYYATTSYYVLKPKPGKVLSIKTSEIQFAVTTKINNSIIFEVWVETPNGKFPVPGSRIAYKNEKDFMTACNGGQGAIQAWGNTTWDTLVFPFDYARPKPLKSSQKVEIRVYCEKHIPLEGPYATGTFYVISEDEV